MTTELRFLLLTATLTGLLWIPVVIGCVSARGFLRPADDTAAPTSPLPDWVAREAYSHEVSSCGFWPGGEALPEPVFYAYAYPEPAGFRTAPVRPAAARYEAGLGEFILPYHEVRKAESPDALLLEFLQSSYEAAINLSGWDRPALEWLA